MRMRLATICALAGLLACCGQPAPVSPSPSPPEDGGTPSDGDACDRGCMISCGDRVVTEGEACDDGNSIDGDGCDRNCTVSECGNGVIAGGEVCDDANASDGDGCDHDCSATACGNAIVTLGEICDDGNATDGDGCDRDCTTDALAMQAYVKASNRGGFFGFDVALSADGTTMAIGAYIEASAARGIDGNQRDESATMTGAVYVFLRAGTRWIQQAYLKASNADAGDAFGHSLALSADGSTLAVGALFEASVARGVNGNQGDNSLAQAGAVYVFTRNRDVWSQQAYLKASNTWAGDLFGSSVALSSDGSTLAVAAVGEDSAAPGINGDQSNDSARGSGAVYVFSRSGAAWRQTTYVKASNAGEDDVFGTSIALSADGATLAAGAWGEDSEATGVNGDQASNTGADSGAVYVFTHANTTWTQQAYVKASNNSFNFGGRVALSHDGSTMIVGAPSEASAATGINGDQNDQSARSAGAVYVFTRATTTWSQQAYIKASNTDSFNKFGSSLALAGDGSTMFVGAFQEESAATGIDGDQQDNATSGAGAVYAFVRDGTSWSQQAYIKASNTDSGDNFGIDVALATDASTLAVGAYFEASTATGIGGDQLDNSRSSTGAVYVFRR
jgi:trimeric autotransporter adhesin